MPLHESWKGWKTSKMGFINMFLMRHGTLNRSARSEVVSAKMPLEYAVCDMLV